MRKRRLFGAVSVDIMTDLDSVHYPLLCSLQYQWDSDYNIAKQQLKLSLVNDDTFLLCSVKTLFVSIDSHAFFTVYSTVFLGYGPGF